MSDFCPCFFSDLLGSGFCSAGGFGSSAGFFLATACCFAGFCALAGSSGFPQPKTRINDSKAEPTIKRECFMTFLF